MRIPPLVQSVFRFRRWSRKRYAAFASLGRCVTIGHQRPLAADCSLTKQKQGTEAAGPCKEKAEWPGSQSDVFLLPPGAAGLPAGETTIGTAVCSASAAQLDAWHPATSGNRPCPRRISGRGTDYTPSDEQPSQPGSVESRCMVRAFFVPLLSRRRDVTHRYTYLYITKKRKKI